MTDCIVIILKEGALDHQVVLIKENTAPFQMFVEYNDIPNYVVSLSKKNNIKRVKIHGIKDYSVGIISEIAMLNNDLEFEVI